MAGGCVEDVAKVARRRLPAGARAYLENGGEGEYTRRRNRAAFDGLEFRPGVRHRDRARAKAVLLGRAHRAIPELDRDLIRRRTVA